MPTLLLVSDSHRLGVLAMIVGLLASVMFVLRLRQIQWEPFVEQVLVKMVSSASEGWKFQWNELPLVRAVRP